jgi:hypothetical protein
MTDTHRACSPRSISPFSSQPSVQVDQPSLGNIGSFIRFRLIRCPQISAASVFIFIIFFIIEGLVVVQRYTTLRSMKTVALALLSVVGSTVAQGVTQAVAPSASPPPGCDENYQGNFEVQVIQPLAKRDVVRVCQGPYLLISATLPTYTVLTDRT